MDPLLLALLYAAGAAGASALAALPFAVRPVLPLRWLGLAKAVAAGLMLGIAYVLLVAGMKGSVPPLAAGAALGVLFVMASERLPGMRASGPIGDPVAVVRLLLSSSAHAAHEGVAIGAALAADVRFGAFTALAIAVHNVPESASLVAELRSRGAGLTEAAGLAVSADANQVLLAVVTLALITAEPALQPWAYGFAVGALIHLVMIELLPASYREAGRTSIAAVTIAAMGAVVLLRSLAP